MSRVTSATKPWRNDVSPNKQRFKSGRRCWTANSVHKLDFQDQQIKLTNHISKLSTMLHQIAKFCAKVHEFLRNRLHLFWGGWNFKFPLRLETQLRDMDLDLVLCCESWACIHLVMPPLFSNHQQWIDAAYNRQDVPNECFGTMSELRFHYNLEFIHWIRNHAFSNSYEHFAAFFSKSWQFDKGSVNSLSYLRITCAFRLDCHAVSF